MLNHSLQISVSIIHSPLNKAQVHNADFKNPNQGKISTSSKFWKHKQMLI